MIQLACMVLSYFTDAHAKTLVLDNLMSAISAVLVRHDLQTVYRFTGIGLWMAKVKSSDRQVGGAEQLDAWRDLSRRRLKATN